MIYLIRKHLFENKDADSSSESKDEDISLDIETLESESEGAEDFVPETLFFSNEEEKRPKKKKKRPGMVKLQKIMIASFLSVAVVLGVLYGVWLGPWLNEQQAEEPRVPVELLEGEAHSDNGIDLAIFEHIQMTDIASIVVHNSYEDFTCLKYEDKEGQFYIKEHPRAPVGTEEFTTFAVDAGYPIVNRRVTANCEDFSLYGLAEEDDPAYYTITDINGTTHTVYIGDQIPSGGGFYARYKDRAAVYVMSLSLANTLLAPSTALMTPMLGYPIDQNSVTMMSEMIMNKNGQPFIFITHTDNPSDEYALSAYEMQYPANYVVNDDNYSTVMLASFTQLLGYQVLEAGSTDALLVNNEEIMSEYGFFDMQNVPYELYYAMEGIPPTVILFAPSGIDGYYFAYSYLYDMIVLVETETVKYLDWDLLEFINSALFAEYINDVKNISVSGALRYDGKVYNIDEKFNISVGEENALTCYAHSTGKTFTGNRPVNNTVQGFYGTALSMKMGGYIKTEGVDVSTLAEYASMTVTLNSGETLEYKFYRYSERCYYTINGQGEFYLSLRDVNKLLIDSVRAAYGEYVDSNEEYPKLPVKYTEKQ